MSEEKAPASAYVGFVSGVRTLSAPLPLQHTVTHNNTYLQVHTYKMRTSVCTMRLYPCFFCLVCWFYLKKKKKGFCAKGILLSDIRDGATYSKLCQKAYRVLHLIKRSLPVTASVNIRKLLYIVLTSRIAHSCGKLKISYAWKRYREELQNIS